MSIENFIDSNVFVYLFDRTSDAKRHRAEALIETSIRQGNACISYQVVQETINAITHKLNASVEDTKQLLDNVLTLLWKVTPTPVFYKRGLDIQHRYQFSFYDSLIVTAALEADCKVLFSEGLQHNQCIEHLTIINPFLVV